MLPNEIAFAKVKAPPVPSNLRVKARECIAQYVERANRELGARLSMPTCSFDLRGKTAGQAYYRQNHVRLNAVLLVENFDDFLSDTIPHEVAHLVARAKHGNGIASHGIEWQRVMRAFGLEPERCHSYDTGNSAVGTALYKHRCACNTFTLSPRKHNSAMRGNLTCKTCKHRLQFTGEARIDGEWRQIAAAPSGQPVPFLRTPVAPPKPAARPALPLKPTPADGPTAPMLSYMQNLARSLGWAIPPEALKFRRSASEFIDRAKAAMQARAATHPDRPSPVSGDAPPAPPTEKQLAYARSIASRKGLTIPSTTLASKQAISAWIDANR